MHALAQSCEPALSGLSGLMTGEFLPTKKRHFWWRILVGEPGRSRTCDLLYRKQTLYPSELRVHRRLCDSYLTTLPLKQVWVTVLVI